MKETVRLNTVITGCKPESRVLSILSSARSRIPRTVVREMTRKMMRIVEWLLFLTPKVRQGKEVMA